MYKPESQESVGSSFALNKFLMLAQIEGRPKAFSILSDFYFSTQENLFLSFLILAWKKRSGVLMVLSCVFGFLRFLPEEKFFNLNMSFLMFRVRVKAGFEPCVFLVGTVNLVAIFTIVSLWMFKTYWSF